ncbi:MAG: hypothetical protein J6Q05_04905 [Elusimicrobiaceae bacterium]|nr:hypothetical protein [Elusimicrobiaceae bacterium]
MNTSIQRGYFSKIAHIWFAETLCPIQADISFFYAMTSPNLKCSNYQLCTPQQTLLTDLTVSINELFSHINKNTRYEIRRAEKEKIICKYWLAQEIPTHILNSFENTYNEMYRAKGLHTKFNRPMVKNYCKNQMILFSVAFSQKKPLVFHSYIIDKTHARFFYSCSPFRSEPTISALIGRMNRYLHWNDWLYLKNKGIQEYDWGGITNSPEAKSISQFKRAFGGKEIERYNYIVAHSYLGILKFLLSKYIPHCI